MRARFLFIILAALLLVRCGGEEPPPRETGGSGANLVLIVVDTLRPDHMGCYGYGRPTTPGIDAIAAEGILFENALSQAAFTLPSMATLFTSLNPPGHGVRRHPDAQGRVDRLSSSLAFLPKILKECGYRTGAVVSNSLFQQRFKGGFEEGFDLFDAGGRRRDAGPTTDLALAWIAENGERGTRHGGEEPPFFLWVHYIDPHWPYDAPAGFERPFGREDGGQFAGLLRRFLDDGLPREIVHFDPPLDAEGLAAGIDAYDNEVAYADAEIGRLMDGLREKGLDGSTVVAVVSDHGEALGEHGLTFAHTYTLYDEVERVAMIVRPPGGMRPVRIARQVRLLDFAPTITGMLGLDQPRGFEGVDLAPLWQEGEDALPDLPAYGESDVWPERIPGSRPLSRKRAAFEGNAGKWRMVAHKGYKLIWIPGIGMELYDLTADPGELNDLSADPPPAARPLAGIMSQFLEEPNSGGAPSSTMGPDLTDETRRELMEILRTMGY